MLSLCKQNVGRFKGGLKLICDQTISFGSLKTETKNYKLKLVYMRRILLLATLVITTFAGARAQGVTTSTMSGTIKDPSGGGIPGANIVATHAPSGTTYGTMSAADGKFIIPNMRTGGPYTVKITFVGYAEQTFGEVYLKLAETYSLNTTLKESSTQLEEVVVSSTQDRLMNSERNGAITSISTREIQTMPTITRSINDMTRMTPQASSANSGAIGGGNYRQNYITVDGSDFNNTFGIGTNLPANGSPISLDALEEISVNVTPYDIRQSGFIGSSINAVTRSGTNEFSGSAYTFWRNQNQQGNEVAGNDKFTRQDLQVNTYGFRLGGPIVKNKLFFFFNAEKGKTISPGQQNFAATTSAPFGSSPNISRPTRDTLDAISSYLKETYGYETGEYDNYDFESENTRFVARLDWNISNNHRFNVRYSVVESKDPRFVSGSRSPMTAYGGSTGRTTNNALWYKNSNYYQEANFYSFAAELNSTFSLFNTNVANTLRGTWTRQNDPRSSDSQVFPLVDILDGSTITGTSAQGTPFTTFGYEPFTFGNLRDVTSYSIVDNLTFTKGAHTITAGFQFDLQQTKNGFQRFATSYYTFHSMDDFVNGVKPVDFAITYSLLPGYKQAFPRFKFAQYSVYGQDEFAVSDRLRLTFGLRLDLPSYLDVEEIKTHPLVDGKVDPDVPGDVALTFADGATIDTGVLPDTKVMFSPRVGFNYDVKGDRSVQLRGGTGIFTGRVPTVWIVSQSGDAGLIQFTQVFQTPNNTGQRNDPAQYVTPGPFNPDPNFYRPAVQPTPGTAIPSTVSAMDPDFKFPQTWKSSLAVDVSLPWGMVGTVEGIYNKDLNIAIGRNPNLITNPQPLNVTDAGGVVYPDNRPIYPNANTNKFINPLLGGLAVPQGTANATAFNTAILDNASKGYYWSVMGKLEKQFDMGLSASFAYVRSQAKVLYDGSGDQLLNTWSITQIVNNSNDPELSFANYVVPDRIVASLSYRKEYLKRFATTLSVFFEGSITGRFSYTYGADFNRDGQTNDLIYVPKDGSEITFTDFDYDPTSGVKIYTATQQEEMFFKYIEQDSYLNSRRGKYAERNGAQMPWRNQMDVRIAQDIFTNVGGKKNTLQFTLDIFNFGNFLNKNWGIFKTVNASALLVPTNTSALTPGGATVPTFRLASDRNAPVTNTYRDNNSIASTYYMQFGLRYIFN